MARGTEWGTPDVNRRKPASRAPFAYQMTTNPSTATVGGKIQVKGSNVSGGNMNGGGKHRPKTHTVS